MNYSFAVNTVLGSCLIIVLIFADYVRKYNTDSLLRLIFLCLLAASLAAILCDFAGYIFEGVPGAHIHAAYSAVTNLYFIFQVLACYLLFAFVNYLSYRDAAKAWTVIRIVLGITLLHIIFLEINISTNYYFYISEDNHYHRGNLYIIRLIISCLPAVFAIVEIVLSRKKFTKYHSALVFLFLILAGAGSAIDILFETGSFIWPCLTSAYLYSYFFIIMSDSRIDSLTGLGNRFSFNEFVEKLSKSAGNESWSIVMMDMDHFKKINDTLGHLEGDNALRDMAFIIKGSIRNSDFAARYGGDEFILAVRAEFDIHKLLERIQEAIDNQNEKNYRPYRLAMSYGCDVYTANSGQSVNDFLKHIDALMYEEKRRKYENGGISRSY
ncbi:MAG: diguanylate cyclase [Treponema sp.]|nr:diguanylate cyclase [Treponema sp.]